MNVIAITTQPDSHHGGKPRVMLEICRGLHQRGHSIDMLYLWHGDLLPCYQEFCTSVMQVKTAAIEKSAPFSTAFSFSGELWQIIRRLRSHPPEETILYADEHQLGLLAYTLARLRGIPAVFHIHQPVLAKLPTKYKFGIERLNHCIAVSEHVKATWQRTALTDIPITVVYNGVDADWFTPADVTLARQIFDLCPASRVISYIGRIWPDKGVETLLRAFAIVNREREEQISLALGGWIKGSNLSQAKRTYQAFLETLAQELGIYDQIRYIEFMDDPRSLYQASDLTVLPSHYPEPFGRTLIESMACGVPALGSNTGGIPEVLGNEFAGMVFPRQDERALARTIQHWLGWREHDPDLGNRCRQYVLSNFSLEKTLDGVEKALADTLSEFSGNSQILSLQ
jgi:glycosyltransferase involved in cell wall biosynthesis